jgi:hypothetical protein
MFFSEPHVSANPFVTGLQRLILRRAISRNAISPIGERGLYFKNVSQIEQILVGKVRDRGFDLGKVPHGVIAAIGDPLHSCLEHVAFYHNRRGGGRGIYDRLAEVIRPKCPLSAGERSFFNGEPDRVLAADLEAVETYSFDCIRRNEGACGLSAFTAKLVDSSLSAFGPRSAYAAVRSGSRGRRGCTARSVGVSQRLSYESLLIRRQGGGCPPP